MLNGKSLPEKSLYPSPTARDGCVRANSSRSGVGQGKGSPARMAHCKQCGFVFNKTKVNHSGGSLSGNGGIGAVVKTVGDAVEDLKTDTFTDGTITRHKGTGDAVVKSGCPMCGSFNGI